MKPFRVNRNRFRARQTHNRWLKTQSTCNLQYGPRTRLVRAIDYRAPGSSRKLGGAAEHLIDGSEKCICRLSFEF